MSWRWSNTSVVFSAIASFSLRRLRQIRRSAGEEVIKRLGTALVLKPTGLLQRCICRPSWVDHQTVAACTERRCLSHHWHQAKGLHHSSADSLTLAADKIANSLQTVPPDAPHSHHPATCLHGQYGWTHSNIFVWPPVCQPPPVPEAITENQVRCASLQSCRLPGIICQTIFSLSQTLNNSRNFSNLPVCV